MKKRILAFVGAMVLTAAMGLNVCAAPSSSAGSNSGTTSTTTAAAEEVKQALSTTTQQFSSATIASFAETTTVEAGPAGAKISAVSVETATAAIAQAKAQVNANAFIAAIVDVTANEAGTFTLTCPNVWAGQKVIILHQLSNGTWEKITPSSVADNKVTFSMTSYSPVAIVIDTTSVKTADVAPVVAVLAVACLAGVVVFGRKKIAE